MTAGLPLKPVAEDTKNHRLQAPTSNNMSVCDFLAKRPQAAWFHRNTFSVTTLTTGASQRCMLTHWCTTSLSSSQMKQLVALSSNKDDTDYRNKVSHLALWCSNNNLNVEKIKEMFVGFRLQASSVTWASISAATPKRWVCIPRKTWTVNTTAMAKKANEPSSSSSASWERLGPQPNQTCNFLKHYQYRWKIYHLN